MNIYDCFMYFDEDMLLDLRLNVLNDHVKKFVITEATYTHNGSKKKLNFDINNYKKFRDKINYIVVDKQPPTLIDLKHDDNIEDRGKKLILNGMARDYFQRENLSKGLLILLGSQNNPVNPYTFLHSAADFSIKNVL